MVNNICLVIYSYFTTQYYFHSWEQKDTEKKMRKDETYLFIKCSRKLIKGKHPLNKNKWWDQFSALWLRSSVIKISGIFSPERFSTLLLLSARCSLRFWERFNWQTSRTANSVGDRTIFKKPGSGHCSQSSQTHAVNRRLCPNTLTDTISLQTQSFQC